MAKTENEQLQKLFARAIFASAIPLSTMTDSEEWKFFFKKLRPSFELPSRHILSNKLLDDEFSCIEMEVNTKIKQATSLGLQCDAWSNRRNESIINFIVTTPKPVFYKTLATKEKRHTAEYMFKIIDEVLKDIGSEKFYAIVTDNASAMVKSRDLISEKYPHISAYSCASHTLNLLIQDFLKTNSLIELENNCIHIIKEINNSHILRATFISIQKEKHSVGISLKMPAKTRWGSFLTCLKSLLDSKYALKSLAVHEESSKILSKRSIICILDEDIFWLRVSKMHELLSPIVKWITILESDKPIISMVAEAFFEIKKILQVLLPSAPLLKNEEKVILETLKKRKDKTLKPIHFAANILDPKFKGTNLTTEEQITGSEFIHQLAEVVEGGVSLEQILLELAEYRAQEGFFGKSYVLKSAEIVSAFTWWKGTCIGISLAKIALIILTMPSTTAATERSFSTYGLIHTAKRNRLSAERSGKLTFVAHNIKLLKSDNQSSMAEFQRNVCDTESDDEEFIEENDSFISSDNEDDF